jgi:hypothetical protein
MSNMDPLKMRCEQIIAECPPGITVNDAMDILAAQHDVFEAEWDEPTVRGWVTEWLGEDGPESVQELMRF